MTYTPTQTLTFDEFIAQYGDNFRYELADGELIDRSLTGPHEAVGGKLATKIGIAIAQHQHPWFIPRTCLIRPFSDRATARRPDIVVLDETALSSEPCWEKEPSITLGRSIKLVVEVVSTNWETDYARKVEEYALLGILEYWIADYRGLGGIAFIGKPNSRPSQFARLKGKNTRSSSIAWGSPFTRPYCPNSSFA